MIHNTVFYKGKEYKAVAEKLPQDCTGCAFVEDDRNEICSACSCTEIVRPDRTSVIFKPHYRKIPVKMGQ